MQKLIVKFLCLFIPFANWRRIFRASIYGEPIRDSINKLSDQLSELDMKTKHQQEKLLWASIGVTALNTHLRHQITVTLRDLSQPGFDTEGHWWITEDFIEPDTLSFIDKYLPPNPVIVDVGANEGNHTLYWASISKAKKVFAFEPIPKFFRNLQYNIELNRFDDRVELFDVALGATESLGKILKDQGTATMVTPVQGKTSQPTFKIETLDQQNFGDTVHLLKIDVEGFEEEVLKGGLTMIRKYKPVIVIESFSEDMVSETMLASIAGQNIQEKCWKILKSLDYQLVAEIGYGTYLWKPASL